MKKKIAVLAIMLCVVSSSTTFARDYNHGGHDRGYNNRSHYSERHRGGHDRGYDNRSHYSRRHRGGHHNDGLGIAFGVVGGLLLGTALISSATPPPPPPTVVYGSTYPTYQPGVIVQQPRICVEDRVVGGEWRTSQYDGRQVWVSFPYPVTQAVQIPCY
jgi:hypothetical protein